MSEESAQVATHRWQYGERPLVAIEIAEDYRLELRRRGKYGSGWELAGIMHGGDFLLRDGPTMRNVDATEARLLVPIVAPNVSAPRITRRPDGMWMSEGEAQGQAWHFLSAAGVGPDEHEPVCELEIDLTVASPGPAVPNIGVVCATCLHWWAEHSTHSIPLAPDIEWWQTERERLVEEKAQLAKEKADEHTARVAAEALAQHGEERIGRLRGALTRARDTLRGQDKCLLDTVHVLDGRSGDICDVLDEDDSEEGEAGEE